MVFVECTFTSSWAVIAQKLCAQRVLYQNIARFLRVVLGGLALWITSQANCTLCKLLFFSSDFLRK